MRIESICGLVVWRGWREGKAHITAHCLQISQGIFKGYSKYTTNISRISLAGNIPQISPNRFRPRMTHPLLWSPDVRAPSSKFLQVVLPSCRLPLAYTPSLLDNYPFLAHTCHRASRRQILSMRTALMNGAARTLRLSASTTTSFIDASKVEEQICGTSPLRPREQQLPLKRACEYAAANPGELGTVEGPDEGY